MDIDKALGAEELPSSQRLCVYIPNKDKNGSDIRDYERWVNGAREILTRIGGGATALPPADGTWERANGDMLWEQTRLVYCFVDPERFEATVNELRAFLHRFGRETNQGEVVVEFDGRFYRIRNYD